MRVRLLWRLLWRQFGKVSWTMLWLFTAAEVTAEQPVNTTCSADLVCVHAYKNDSVRLVLDNKTTKPLTFQLYLRGDSVRQLQLERLFLKQPTTQTLISFPAPADTWGYEFRIHYGHTPHRHDDSYVYSLPYARPNSYAVSQSHHNLTTHRQGNRFAIDWDMALGEPVHAAREGVVVSTFDESTRSSLTGSEPANHVWIQHSDGTIGKYLHLAANSVTVQEGQVVAVGDAIAASGETGYSRGPHLHFSVSAIAGRDLYQTFNLQFNTSDGVQNLQSGKQYSHPAP